MSLAPLGIPYRHCQQIGLDEMFPGVTNPFPWMAEMIDLKKEKNFFETRVTEYQTGGALSWGCPAGVSDPIFLGLDD